MMRDEPEVLEPFSIRAVRAEVFNELQDMRAAGTLVPTGLVHESMLEIVTKIQHLLAQQCLEGNSELR